MVDVRSKGYLNASLDQGPKNIGVCDRPQFILEKSLLPFRERPVNIKSRKQEEQGHEEGIEGVNRSE
jgi:hypothetical protein